MQQLMVSISTWKFSNKSNILWTCTFTQKNQCFNFPLSDFYWKLNKNASEDELKGNGFCFILMLANYLDWGLEKSFCLFLLSSTIWKTKYSYFFKWMWVRVDLQTLKKMSHSFWYSGIQEIWLSFLCSQIFS